MRQKDEMERTENARARSNRHILWLTYGIAALFIAMAVYFGWFIQFKSENVIGSSYNARLDLLSDRVTRGSIMSNDKTVLAQTNVASDGSEKRYYPYDYLFVHSVGYSGKNGKTGLESLANFYLLSSHVNLIEKTINEFQGKKNLGDNVITTLDVDLQQTASDAIGKHRGAVIVMEPDTGKILTMVSQPNFNANLVDERWAELISPDNTKAQLVNRATQGLYPPGSTFKMLTAAAAIDCGATSPQEGFYCSGRIAVDGSTVRCWGAPHGAETMARALENSCNPVFTQLALRLGSERFYQYLHAFGLGRRTGIDLYGEAGGILIGQSRVKNVDLARIGFGQSVAVTPIQMITAACAVVNGGRLMKPYLVEAIEDSDGNLLRQTSPQVAATPISAETSATMRRLLYGVVENGGGKNAKTSGYAIGGKTGTAQIYKNGKIESNLHIGSFVGFAPAESPKVALLVTVNEAKVKPDFGGTTAAPFAAQIFEEILPLLGVAKTDGSAEAERVTMPDVTGMDVRDAKAILREAGIGAVTDGESPRVTGQLPPAGATVQAGFCAMLYVTGETAPQAQDYARVPDVLGLDMRESAQALRLDGFEMNAQGDGLAARQSPIGGSYAPEGTQVLVTFEMP